jgi:hypothetical protein
MVISKYINMRGENQTYRGCMGERPIAATWRAGGQDGGNTRTIGMDAIAGQFGQSNRLIRLVREFKVSDTQ